MSSAPWKVGEVARRSGLSVRTLHYYDAIGLLTPRLRSDAGYRLYMPSDVVRLQKIKLLQGLGFPLDEVGALLDRRDVSLHRVIGLHIERLREQMALQHTLFRRLEFIAARLADAQEVGIDEFFYTLEVLSSMDRIKQYYSPSPEQLAALAQRRQQLGNQGIKSVESEWPELIAQVRAHMERGTPPVDDQVQALGCRWKALVDTFTGGDTGIANTLQRMYQNEPGVRSHFGLDSNLSKYVSEVLAAAKQ
ncbi:MAG: MerR family transcriptional regulator [Ramlibacter sp.]